MSRSCESYELLISQAIDGELTPAEEASLREHLRSCPDCRRTAAAFAGLSRSLREELSEPPASLLDGVLARIAEEDAPAADEGPERPAPRVMKPSRRIWKRYAVAAAVFVVVAAGAYAASRGARSASEAAPESAEVYEAAADAAYEAAPAEEPAAMAPMPAPLPEENAAYGSAAVTEASEAEADAAARDIPAEDAGRGLSIETAAALYTLDTPAAVPAGQEASFEALNRSAGTAPETDTAIVAYVEYRGVIYEYSTDGEHLIWRDAAEGMPALSPGTVEDLLDILG